MPTHEATLALTPHFSRTWKSDSVAPAAESAHAVTRTAQGAAAPHVATAAAAVAAMPATSATSRAPTSR